MALLKPLYPCYLYLLSLLQVGGQLSPGAREQGGVLDIPSVTAADAGTYRCIAVNAAGRAEAYSEVVVSGKEHICLV